MGEGVSETLLDDFADTGFHQLPDAIFDQIANAAFDDGGDPVFRGDHLLREDIAQDVRCHVSSMA